MLVEREQVAAELTRLLDDCSRGSGAAVVLSGTVGAGKTVLLEELQRHATAAGMRLMSAHASREERDLPLGVVSQYLLQLGAAADSPEAAKLLTTFSKPALQIRPRRSYSYVRDRFCRFILDLSREAPLLLSVEDVHNADIESVRTLAQLSRRVRTWPVFLALTESTRVQPASTLLQAELLPQSGCRTFHLEPLSVAAVEELIAHRSDPAAAKPADPRLAARLHALSNGNPGLVQALISDSDVASGNGRSAYGQVLMTMLHRYERCVLPMLQALAVVGSGSDHGPQGEHVDLGLVAELAGLEFSWVERAIGALNRSGILEGFWFRHPCGHALLLDSLETAELAELHARAARLIHERGAPVERLLGHLRVADTAAVRWAIPLLAEAGEQAMARGEVEFARSCLRLAHRIGGEEAHRATANVALTRAEWRMAPALAVRHVPHLVADVRAGHLAVEHAVLPIASLLWFGRVQEALEALADLARLTEQKQDESDQVLDSVRAMAVWLYPSLGHRFQFSEPGGPASFTARTRRLIECIRLLEDLDSAGDTQAADAGTLLSDRKVIAVVISLVALICGDRLDCATRWSDVVRREVESLCGHTWQAVFSAVRAEIAFRQGDVTGAERYGRNALALLPPESWGVMLGFTLSTLLMTLVAMNRQREAADLLRIEVPDAVFQTIFGLLYLRARGRHWMASGDLPRAYVDFCRCGELMMRWGVDDPELVGWRLEAAGALDAMGQRGFAEDLREEHLRLFEPGRPRQIGGGDVASRADLRVPPAGAVPPRTLVETELSEAERKVATLAAQGLTNRQIATSLYVTMSTVEQHLTRIYRKLGVGGRRQLKDHHLLRIQDLSARRRGITRGPGSHRH